MASINIGHRETPTLNPRNVNTTLYRLRYGDLFLTIDCSYSKDYLPPNCSAYNRKFKMATKIIGHWDAQTLDLSNVSSTLYRLRYVALCLTIDCYYSKDYLQQNCSVYNNKVKMASKIIGHRKPRTLDRSKVNRTLYRLRYGDLFLTIDCSCPKTLLAIKLLCVQ